MFQHLRKYSWQLTTNFYTRFVDNKLKVRIWSLQISYTFSKVHFYQFALECFVGVKFILSGVRFIESTCDTGMEETCIVYGYTYGVNILWYISSPCVELIGYCSNSNVIYTLSRIRNINTTIKSMVTYLLCTEDIKSIDSLSKSSIRVNSSCISGSHYLSPHISLSNSHPSVI